MSGTSLALNYQDNTAPIVHALQRVMRSGQRTRPLMQSIGEYLIRSTLNRFDAQVSPQGIPWQEDTPAVWAKKKIQKILTESSHLKGSVVYRASDHSVEWGTNKIYGRIHQEGGTIKHQERDQVIHFKRGTVDLFASPVEGTNGLYKRVTPGGQTIWFKRGAGAGFAKANKRASYAMKVKIGAHETQMPARPYLGISSADASDILLRINDYLQRAVVGS